MQRRSSKNSNWKLIEEKTNVASKQISEGTVCLLCPCSLDSSTHFGSGRIGQF